MLNTQRQTIATLGFSVDEQPVDVPAGINTHGFIIHLEAVIDIAAGGGADGTLQTEGIQRLIQSFRFSHDGRNRIGPLNGRDLWQVSALQRLQVTDATNLAGAGIQTTTVSMDLYVPLAYQFLARPIDTVWPGNLPVNDELRLFVQFETSATNAGDTAGSGAFVVPGTGTRVITITGVSMRITQVYSTRVLANANPQRNAPWFLPQIQVRSTPQFLAADTELTLRLRGVPRFAAVIWRSLEDVTADAAALINTISLTQGGGSRRDWAAYNFADLQEESLGRFPALATIGQLGTATAYFVDGGLLGNAVDPRELSDPAFQFDVDLPAAPGVVRGIFFDLLTVPGITSVQD